MIGSIALTGFFVLLNAFFVAAEFAIVKVRASQIDLKVRNGDVFAKIARHILDHIDAYLSACQLGITLASLALGWIGEPVVAGMIYQIAGWLGIEVEASLLHTISVIIAFSIITVLHIVIGELAPKTLAISRPETVSLAVALPLHGFYLLFRPFIASLNWMGLTLLKVMGFQAAPHSETHSPDELRYLIAQTGEQGGLEQTEREIIENVFEFTETTVSQVMVPRSKVVAVEISQNLSEILDTMMDEGYSRLPVYSETINDIQGIVYSKDMLTLLHHKNLIVLQDILHPVFYVQEDTKLEKLLRDMQKQKVHMAVVLDEFGGTAGLLTLEDVLEELVGNIQDEYDDEAPLASEHSTNVWEFDASIHIDEANEVLPVPLPESDDYETIGGIINAAAGRISRIGDTVELAPYCVTILAASPRKVERVQFTWQVPETADENSSPTT